MQYKIKVPKLIIIIIIILEEEEEDLHISLKKVIQKSLNIILYISLIKKIGYYENATLVHDHSAIYL